MKNRSRIVLIYTLFLSNLLNYGCKKKYTCSCTNIENVCYNCYSSNEPIGYTNTKNVGEYQYKSKNESEALSACSKDHAVNSYTIGNTRAWIQCKIQ